MLHTIKFITGNKNKLREACQILGMDIESGDAGELDELQTISVEEVIRHKAEEAYKKIQSPLIVEDSGLVFLAWKGLPGALIKWFEQTVGNEGILKMMESETDRRAVAQCYIAFHDGLSVEVVKGEIPGTISTVVRGSSGFGWDQIFIPDGHTRTFAEMQSEEKNAISHRKNAFENLKKLLKNK